MNNMNIDENTMKNIKNMVDNGNLSDAISQISPEMMQNFSKMLSNQNNSQNQNNTQNSSFDSNQQNCNESNNNSSNTNNNFDFSNLDMDTIMKLSSAFGKMKNSKNDPRANLLNSLKPYLRDNKKEKLDSYINLLNMSKIAENIKNNKNFSNKEDT